MLHAIRQEIADSIADTLQQATWDIQQRITPGRDRRYIPVALKRQIKQAADYTCQHCQRKGTEDTGPDGRGWHIDHVTALAKGGQTARYNLALSCATCNQRKAAR